MKNILYASGSSISLCNYNYNIHKYTACEINMNIIK